MNRVALVFLLLLTMCGAQPVAQCTTLLGVLRCASAGAAAATTPCDLVTTCVAAYSVRRKVVAAYAGSALQLSKTGPVTQDIGFSAGTVDGGAINTFCGSNNANSCRIHKLYDQSGNGNHLTCGKVAGLGAVTVTCTTYTDDIPLTYVGSWGSAPTISVTGDGTHFLNNAAPTAAPTGASSITVFVAGNDSNAGASASHYAIDFGMFHPTDVSNVDLTNFGATLRADAGNTRLWGLDLETTSLELVYGLSTGTTTYTSPSLDDLSNLGDFVGSAVYDSGSGNVTVDLNNGVYTYTNSITTPNWGGAGPAAIRLHAGGDGTNTPGIFYEGLIYASALSGGNRSTVSANQISAMSVTSGNPCTAMVPQNAVTLIGRNTLTTAYGLRQMDPYYKGAVLAVYGVTSATYKAIGIAAGTCDVDAATMSTFCSGQVCRVAALFPQVFIAGHKDPFSTGVTNDMSLVAGSTPPTSTAPTITFSCLGSKPCMEFLGSSTQRLGSSTGHAVTRPYTILAVAKKISGSTYAAVFGDNNSGNMFFGSGPSAGTINFYAGASFEGISGLVNGTWYALAGMVPINTTITACADGTCASNTSATTTDIASAGWATGVSNATTSPLTGEVVELVFMNSTAISNGTAASVSTEQHAYWGF